MYPNTRYKIGCQYHPHVFHYHHQLLNQYKFMPAIIHGFTPFKIHCIKSYHGRSAKIISLLERNFMNVINKYWCKKTILMFLQTLKTDRRKMDAFSDLQPDLCVKKKKQENGWRKVKSEWKRS